MWWDMNEWWTGLIEVNVCVDIVTEAQSLSAFERLRDVVMRLNINAVAVICKGM